MPTPDVRIGIRSDEKVGIGLTPWPDLDITAGPQYRLAST